METYISSSKQSALMHAMTPVMAPIDTEESKVPAKMRQMRNDGTTVYEDLVSRQLPSLYDSVDVPPC